MEFYVFAILASSSAAGGRGAVTDVGEGSMGTRWEEGGSPKFVVAPVKLMANALQDIFASNWFQWDAPSRTPCARGGTLPSSHRSAAVSQVPRILRLSSFGDAFFSSQNTTVPAVLSWHFKVPYGQVPVQGGRWAGRLELPLSWVETLAPTHFLMVAAQKLPAAGPERGGGGPPALRAGFVVGAPKWVGFFLNPPLWGNKRLFLQRLGQVSCH